MGTSAFAALAAKVNNWKRWGNDDQRGTLNHIDEAALQRAGATVRQGKLFSLGLPFDRNGPQIPGSHRDNPQLYVTARAQPMSPEFPSCCFTDDVIHMHAQCSTQWDALAHVHYDGELYNGRRAEQVLTTGGALSNGVEALARPGIMGRGVLLDIARLEGIDRLPPDYEITPDDLNHCCERHGIALAKGDIVLVRTGHIRCFTVDGDRALFNGHQAGLGGACAEWLYDHSAAAVCADNVAVERLGADVLARPEPLPLHMLCLRDMGMPLGEMWDLEALAADCAADGQYTFMLAAPPLALTGAVGSPVNPLALK